MKTTVNFSEFHNLFKKIRPNNFSYEGLRVLFEYIEMVEDSCGDEFELDIIGLCCDFSESDWQTIAADYSIELDETENDDEQEAQVLDFLADRDVLIGETSNSIVYRSF